MAPYESSGSLTSSQKQISVSGGWDTQSEWSNFQSASNVDVSNGTVTLAQVSQTIDNFEDGNINEYSGSVGDASVTQSVVQDGSYALAMEPNGNAISSTSGLDNYPSAGDTFNGHFQLQDSSADFAWIGWAMQSESGTRPDGYWAQVATSDSSLKLFRMDGGSTELDSSSQSYTAGDWYRIRVMWGAGGSITVELYDNTDSLINQVSASDSTFSSGGIGFYANEIDGDSTAQYFDNFYLE